VTSVILRTATRVLMPLLLLFGVFVLFRGHNAPGGGFVGGLVVAAAFVLYAAAHGVPASRRALLVDSSTLLATGLAIVLLSALPGLLLGRPFLTGVWIDLGRGAAAIPIGTPLLFDIGVFLAVIGVVLTIVFALADASGAETQ
jgi:multicomponent Na+:H+ antiporter subunit B